MKKIIIYLVVFFIVVILISGGLIIWKGRQRSANKLGSQQYQQAIKNLSAINTNKESVTTTTKKNTVSSNTVTSSDQTSVAEAVYNKATDLNISSEDSVKAIDTIMKPIFSKTWGGAKLTAYNTNAYNYNAMAGGTLVDYKVKKEISANDTNTLIANFKSAGVTVKMSSQDSQSVELSVMKDNIAYDISYDVGDQEIVVGVVGTSSSEDSASSTSGDES